MWLSIEQMSSPSFLLVYKWSHLDTFRNEDLLDYMKRDELLILTSVRRLCSDR